MLDSKVIGKKKKKGKVFKGNPVEEYADYHWLRSSTGERVILEKLSLQIIQRDFIPKFPIKVSEKGDISGLL